MAQRQHTNGFETITIFSNDRETTATFVPARGGAASSITMPTEKGSKELLFLHDFFWDKTIPDLPGGWPFCFPVCARLEYQGKQGAYCYEDQQYELPIHGFSWLEPWSLEEESDDAITLVLRDNVRTRTQYPFKFEVKLRYEIAHGKLICRQTYRNLSDKPMPYYAGFHPYFLTPTQEKENVLLNYRPIKRFLYNDNLTDVVGEGTLFTLPTSVSNPEINEQLTKVGKEKEVALTYPSGEVIHFIATGEEDPDLFPYVQLYTIPDKPFFCAEPWMSYPNAMNQDEGVRWLKPGQSEHGVLVLWVGKKIF